MRKDGGPAFPGFPETVGMQYMEGCHPIDCSGLTKRQWYAGLAMQGLLVCDADYAAKTYDRHLVERAFAIADAMLSEKQEPNQ